MPRYKTVSMPAVELEALLELLADHIALTTIQRRAVDRLVLAAEGRDRRVTNRHNTWNAKESA